MKILVTFLLTVCTILVTYSQQLTKRMTVEYITTSKNIKEPNTCSIYVTIDENGKLFKNQVEISAPILLKNIKTLLSNCEGGSTIKYFIAHSSQNIQFDIWQSKTLWEIENYLNTKAKLQFSRSIDLLTDDEWDVIYKKFSPTFDIESCCHQE